MVDVILKDLSPLFERLYAKTGRPSGETPASSSASGAVLGLAAEWIVGSPSPYCCGEARLLECAHLPTFK